MEKHTAQSEYYDFKCFLLISLFLFFVVVGMKLRALLLLGNHPTTEMHPEQSLLYGAAVIAVTTVVVPASQLHLDI